MESERLTGHNLRVGKDVVYYGGKKMVTGNELRETLRFRN